MPTTMDSLQLPEDMLWSGKLEPLSPDYSHTCNAATVASVAEEHHLWPQDDNILFSYFDLVEDSSSHQAPATITDDADDDDYDDVKKYFAQDADDEVVLETKKTPEELLQELIELKEEGQWLNQENIDLSLLTQQQDNASYQQPKAPVDPIEATELILNEIKTFCSDYEAATGYQHLTPPQSPPTSPGLLFAQQQQHQPTPQTPQNLQFGSMTSTVVDLQLQSNDCLDKTFLLDAPNTTTAPPPAPPVQPSAPVDSDLVEWIDDLLRNKTRDVHENYVLVADPVPSPQQQPPQSLDYCDDNTTQYSTPSYGNSVTSSPSSSTLVSDDDEWMPKAKRGKRSATGAESECASPTKRRPYERGGGELEKKSRKKEQNKNAATRYRQKKKQEVETILEEETRLQGTNKKLQAKFSEARRELRYLRNLLRDMYQQNGVQV